MIVKSLIDCLRHITIQKPKSNISRQSKNIKVSYHVRMRFMEMHSALTIVRNGNLLLRI